jgi:signal transduction histidine kinase
VRPRVLLVDDEPLVLSALRRGFRNEPWDTVVATSGTEALEIIRREPVDVVVTDHDMPGIAGTEVLAVLRREHPEIARFMLTGKATLAVTVSAINDGAIARFFTKPCDAAELAAAIRDALDERAAREAIERRLSEFGSKEVSSRLAGGVAHDIANVLTVIAGRGRLLMTRPGAGAGGLARDAEAILQAAERGAVLTRRFLSTLRSGGFARDVVDLNAVVAGARDLLRHLVGPNVDIEVTLDPAPMHVIGDPAQLEQVVMNLALNADDAMPEGGRLMLETTLGDASVEPGDSHLILRVRDTGVGMSAAVRARIFEPFFTTKAPGKGTGLGLTTVTTIVAQHHGTIAVDSTPGYGTTFTVALPRSHHATIAGAHAL